MTPHRKTNLRRQNGKLQLTYTSKPLKKQVLLLALQLQPNCGTYPILQI